MNKSEEICKIKLCYRCANNDNAYKKLKNFGKYLNRKGISTSFNKELFNIELIVERQQTTLETAEQIYEYADKHKIAAEFAYYPKYGFYLES